MRLQPTQNYASEIWSDRRAAVCPEALYSSVRINKIQIF